MLFSVFDIRWGGPLCVCVCVCVCISVYVYVCVCILWFTLLAVRCEIHGIHAALFVCNPLLSGNFALLYLINMSGTPDLTN